MISSISSSSASDISFGMFFFTSLFFSVFVTLYKYCSRFVFSFSVSCFASSCSWYFSASSIIAAISSGFR